MTAGGNSFWIKLLGQGEFEFTFGLQEPLDAL
jgi:hypothetical protein